MPTLEEQQMISGMTTPQIPTLTSNFNIPQLSQLSATDLLKASESPFTVEDTRKLLGELKGQQVKIAELLKPSTREQQLQQQIGGLVSSAEMGIAQEAERLAPLQFITGAQTAIERRAATQLAPLQRQLGIEQQVRAGELKGAELMSESTRQQLGLVQQFEQQALQRQQLIFQVVNQLRDDARQAFNTIITNFGGLAFEDLDEGSRTQLKQLARNVGLPEGLLREGMKTVKDRQLALQQQQQIATQAQRDIQNEIAATRLGIDAARLEIARQKAAGGGISDGLLGAVLQNPDVYHTLTPTTKEKILPALTAVGFQVPKKLSGEQERAKANAQSAISNLDVLQNAFDQDKNIFKKESLSPFGIGFRNVRLAKKEVQDVITRLRTGAALNESEIKFYRGYVPGVFDSPTESQFKLNTLRNFYQLFTANPGQSFPDVKKKLAEQLREGEILIQNKQTGSFEALPSVEYNSKIHYKLTF